MGPIKPGSWQQAGAAAGKGQSLPEKRKGGFGAGPSGVRRGTRSGRKQSRERAERAERVKPRTAALRVLGLEPEVEGGPRFPYQLLEWHLMQ